MYGLLATEIDDEKTQPRARIARPRGRPDRGWGCSAAWAGGLWAGRGFGWPLIGGGLGAVAARRRLSNPGGAAVQLRQPPSGLLAVNGVNHGRMALMLEVLPRSSALGQRPVRPESASANSPGCALGSHAALPPDSGRRRLMLPWRIRQGIQNERIELKPSIPPPGPALGDNEVVQGHSPGRRAGTAGG